MNDQKNNKRLSPLKFDVKFDGIPVYVLPGEPLYKTGTSRVGEGTMRSKTIDIITIQSQHDDRPLLKGPLKFMIHFYYPLPIRYTHRKFKELQGNPHTLEPSLLNLTKYIQEICRATIFNNEAFISTIEASKLYDYEPRTEFMFIELS